MDQNKYIPWLTIILATFTFLLSGLTGYVIYQNLTLQKQIKNLSQQQEQFQVTPAPTNQSQQESKFEDLNQPSPTPDPTVDWQTYSNQQYRFQFKYPSNWTLRKDTQPNQTIVKSEHQQFTIITDLEGLGDFCGEIVNEETIIVSGISGTKALLTGITNDINCDNSKNSFIWINLQNNNHKYLIMMDYLKTDSEIAEKTFNQILSTFQFLD